MSSLLFAGSSHPVLAHELSAELGIPLGELSLFTFPDGETGVEVKSSPRGKIAFVLQSCVGKANDYLFELALIIDALKRGGAEKIIPILPYFPYCRQDRIDRAGESIAARVVADLLQLCGASKVMAVELHQGQLEGFFSIPFVHVRTTPALFIEPLNKLFKKPPLFVAPDVGSIKIARGFATAFEADFVVIDKQRRGERNLEMSLIGDVRGREVVITDDLASTGRTLTQAAKLCKERGAERVLALITHALLDEKGWEEFHASPIEKLLVTNSSPNLTVQGRVEVISLAPLLKEALYDLIQN